MQTETERKYPCLNRFSNAVGIAPDRLLRAFEIEKRFHDAILLERDFSKRQALYAEVYTKVHSIYGKVVSRESENPKDRIVRLFASELRGKSILDIGCGQGHFLRSVKQQLVHGRLVGIDISKSVLPTEDGIEFIWGDIIEMPEMGKFDVAISDNVFEHIAPQDADRHLQSIVRSLRRGGTFIALIPNRLFGPSDVTRILDFSYSGRIPAKGTHLNESTYSEMRKYLLGYGFRNLRTVIPIPRLKFWMGSTRIPISSLIFLEKHFAWLFRGIRLPLQIVIIGDSGLEVRGRLPRELD
jgi:SAM-dependent methyltransferase